MNGRERVKCTLNHQTPDRIAIDFGGTYVSGMHVTCVAALHDYYGLKKQPVKVCEPYQMLGEIDHDLLNILEIDTVNLPALRTIFGFKNDNWKEFKTPWGQNVLISENFVTSQDSNGDLLLYPEGDQHVPASARMPTGSFFFDTIIRQEPIDEDNLNPQDNLEEFTILSDDDLKYYKTQAQTLASSDRAVVGGIGGTAFGDIALVPAPFLKHPKGIRDITEWYVTTATRQDYVHKIFSKQCEIVIQNLQRIREILINVIDVFYICGTDFGTQTSSFCSTNTFKELYAPYYKKVNQWVHQNTPWKTFKHSCGAVEKFIPHFIEAGFDIINPVQCSAKGMDPKILKERYGNHITFWGGGIDTQQTLPFGTPEQVRQEVLERCKIFAPNGGFVYNTIHNIQAMTPTKNIVAMINAIREFNGSNKL